MQISRMFEMLYILLERERISAAELAKRLEVSVRTVYRDAQALSEAGVPIYAERGRNGGICILPSFKLSRALLNESDRRSILASLRALHEAGADDASTLRKMTAILGEIEPDWVQIDLSDWSGTQNQLLTTLKKAIWEKRIVEFTYYGETGKETLRRVCPQKLWFKARTWYLCAYCLLREDNRTFKLTRIKRARIIPGEFPAQALMNHPAPDSAAYDALPTVSIVLEIDRCMAFRVWDDFDESQILVKPDGGFLVRATYPAGGWVTSLILGYGEHARVLAPDSLCSEMREILQNMLSLYKT